MPKIPQVIAQQASFGRPANRLDFGAGQAEATRELAGSVAGVGDVAGQLFDLEMQTRVNQATVEAATEISNLEFQESQNPDHMGREARFRAASQKIRDRFSKSLAFPQYQSAFGLEFDDVAELAGVRLRTGAQKATFEQTRAVLDVSAREFSRLAAQEPPGPGREAIVNIFRKGTANAENLGAITAEDRIAREYAFEDEILSVDIRGLIRDNPEAAVAELLDPAGRISTGLPPEVAAVWLDRALSAYESELGEQAREEDRQEKRQEKERRAAAELLQDELDAYLDPQQPGGVNLEKLKARLDEPETTTVLKTEEYRFYRRRLLAGGGLSTVESNAEVYDRLSQMVHQDDQQLRSEGALEDEQTLRDQIRSAYRGRQLSKSDRDRLLQLRDDHRFGLAEDHIRTSLAVDLMMASESNLGNVALAEGLRSFQEWKQLSPEATRQDSMRVANNIVGSLLDQTADGFLSTSLDKRHAQYYLKTDTGTVDLVRSNAAIQEAVGSNALTRAEARKIVNKLQLLSEFEQARSQRDSNAGRVNNHE